MNFANGLCRSAWAANWFRKPDQVTTTCLQQDATRYEKLCILDTPMHHRHRFRTRPSTSFCVELVLRSTCRGNLHRKVVRRRALGGLSQHRNDDCTESTQYFGGCPQCSHRACAVKSCWCVSSRNVSAAQWCILTVLRNPLLCASENANRNINVVTQRKSKHVDDINATLMLH